MPPHFPVEETEAQPGQGTPNPHTAGREGLGSWDGQNDPKAPGPLTAGSSLLS